MKWYSYLICAVLILLGTFFGIKFYQKLTAESYVNGQINIQNEFSMKHFKYTTTGLAFYHDEYDETNTYYFEKQLLKVEDFNGLKYEYQITLNNIPLLNAEIFAGEVTNISQIDFRDTQNQMLCQAEFKIHIVFISDKTILRVETTGQKNAEFLNQYFLDNGFKLEIKQYKGEEKNEI